MTKIWQCKIGEVEGTTAPSDPFMRAAVARAYVELTGAQPKFTFSGWGATLTEGERAVVENRLPVETDEAPDVAAYLHHVAAYFRRRADTATATNHPRAPKWAAAWIDRAETTERIAKLLARGEHKAAEIEMPEFWTDYGENLVLTTKDT